MARHLLPFISILFTLIVFGAILAEARSNYPWEGEELPPELKKGWNAFIKKCAGKLTNGCDRQLSDYIFYRKESMEINCCNKIRIMGETCHKAISYSMSRIERFVPWKGHIYNRSMEGYNDCIVRT